MFNEFDNEFGDAGFNVNPARQTLVATGYDKTCYISTAKIASSPYTSQALIEAKIGGSIRLIEACDDSSPPLEDLTGAALEVFNNVVQNVTTEINGFLSSIYPIPLVQTGTVCIVRVKEVSDDGLGTIEAIELIDGGNYLTAPATDQSPVYLRHIDPMAMEKYFGDDWQWCQKGVGAALTVTYADTPYSDENGSTVNAKTVTAVPVIDDGGTGYNIGDLLVLTGGQSFVPAKIREAALILVCHSLYQRRLAPDEKNTFATQAKMWREKLAEIGNGNDEQLDGTYKRSFSIGAAWVTKSVLFGANSL